MIRSTNILLVKAIIILGLVASIAGIILAYMFPSLGGYLLMFNLLPSICALLVLFAIQHNLDQNQSILSQQNQSILDKQIVFENELKTGQELILQQKSTAEKQRIEMSNLKDDFSKQVQELDSVNSSIENQSNKIQGYGEELLNFQANLKEQNNLISLAQAGINEQNGNNVLIKSSLKEQGIIVEVLKSDLSKFSAKQNDHEVKISSLSTGLEDKGKAIITLQSEVQSNQKNLKEKAEIISQNSNEIAQHENKINALKKENLSQSEKLSKQENEISTLFTQLKSESDKITSNYNALNTHNSKLETHSGNISAIHTDINEHQLGLKKQQTDLNNIQKTFGDQFNEIVKQQQQTNIQIENIGVNQNNLTNKLVNQYNSLQNLTTNLVKQEGALKEHTSYLKNTQEELASQRDKFIEQNSAWSHQTFDNTFFKFLESHNTMTSTMELFTSGKGQKVSLAQGKGCFTFFHKKLAKKVAEYTEYTLQNTLAAYNVFYRDYKTELEPYFKNIYQALKFVEESEIKEVNKERYAHFVRAQLSAHELNLIYYHALSMHTEKNLKGFLEKYTMFKNLDVGLLYSKSHDNEYKTKEMVQSASEN